MNPDNYAFDMYFASITSFQYHPANPVDTRMSLEACAALAIEMMILRNLVLENRPWLGLAQQLER